MMKNRDRKPILDPAAIVADLRKSALKHRSNGPSGKRRFGLHKYLRRVYRMYFELSSKRKFERIIRDIAVLAEIHVRRDMHALRILIEASCGPENAKQKSRWVQALQYVYGWKLQPRRVQWCFRISGGVYGCARKQAALNKAAKASARPGFSSDVRQLWLSSGLGALLANLLGNASFIACCSTDCVEASSLIYR